MSSLTQFTVTGKEKDDFYGIHITGMSNQEIKRTVTKSITGKERNQHLYEYALSTAYDASTLAFTGVTLGSFNWKTTCLRKVMRLPKLSNKTKFLSGYKMAKGMLGIRASWK